MPRYTVRDLAVNAVLSNMSVAHTQDSFAANKIFGVCPVEEQTFRYKIFSREDFLRTDAKPRTPGSKAIEKTFGISEGTGFAEQLAIGMILPDEDRATKDSVVDDALEVELISQDLCMRRDLDFVTAYMASSVWGNTDQVGVASGASSNQFVYWDTAGATIISNVLAWKRVVKAACGRWPTVAGITPDVWDVIQDDPDIVDRIKHTSKDPVTPELVARLMGLEEIVIIDSVRATSQENASTFTSAFMDSEKFLLAFRESSPQKRKPSAGYIFSWAKFDQVKEPMENGGAAILKWRDEDIHSDRFEGQMCYVMKIVTSSAGILARNILST